MFAPWLVQSLSEPPCHRGPCPENQLYNLLPSFFRSSCNFWPQTSSDNVVFPNLFSWKRQFGASNSATKLDVLDFQTVNFNQITPFIIIAAFLLSMNYVVLFHIPQTSSGFPPSLGNILRNIRLISVSCAGRTTVPIRILARAHFIRKRRKVS